ncbi:hypothetical protein PIB30_083109, partial [Stylosanthes scabra]|nr:hypothetical protein [Stylosanthes scabra]
THQPTKVDAQLDDVLDEGFRIGCDFKRWEGNWRFPAAHPMLPLHEQSGNHPNLPEVAGGLPMR